MQTVKIINKEIEIRTNGMYYFVYIFNGNRWEKYNGIPFVCVADALNTL